MKDTTMKLVNIRTKSKPIVSKTKLSTKKPKDPKPSKINKNKKSVTKVAKKPKSVKEIPGTTPKRKRGRPRNDDSTQTKKKIKKQKIPKNIDNKTVNRKRKHTNSVNIKQEKDQPYPLPKKPKISDSNLNLNGNIKSGLPICHKPCNPKGGQTDSTTNHVNSNGVVLNKTLIPDTKKESQGNSIIRKATFIPPVKEQLNGKSCLKIFKPLDMKQTKPEPKSPSNVFKKDSKPNKLSDTLIPFKEPIKLHPQRMASLDAMAKLHVICIPDRKPIEHHSRTTTSVVTVCSQPSTHQKSVTQVHERIHFDVKKEGKDCKGHIVHKQINYVKEKQEVYVSHSVEESSSNTSSIKSEKDNEKKKKIKPSQKPIATSRKELTLSQCASKPSSASSIKSEKKKAVKNNQVENKSAKTSKISKQIKNTAKDKQAVKGINSKSKKLEQTKSEVKVKETIRMQKTCTYQSVTTVNSHGSTNSSVVPVSHVGLTTNFSKTKKTVVTDEKSKNNLNYTSGSVINNSYCVTSGSPCSLGHQADSCKFHTHNTPQIIPFAHVQTCSLGHSLNRTSDSSNSSASRCDGNFALHRFGHQQPLIYSSSQDCGCCCTGSLVSNVRDPCLLSKSIVAYPRHFSHHAHFPSGTFASHESLCNEYHPTNASLDVSPRHHTQHISLSPSSQPRSGCCSFCDHHQSSNNCFHYLSSPKNPASISTCEPSPLDLSIASGTSANNIENDHSLKQGHYTNPICCAEILFLRTSSPHSCQHVQFPHKTSCCRCSKAVTCENSKVDSVQCKHKTIDKNNQVLQLAGNASLQSCPTTNKSLVLPNSSISNTVTKDGPHIIKESALQAKLEKSNLPKQISKVLVPVSKKRQFAHGWSWKGKPKEKLIAFTNDSTACSRICYPSVEHKEGDVINERDCVLLKSGPKDTDLPYVAKVTSLWENPEDGEMMMSLLWYYRPEHTDQGRKHGQMEDEVFASRHKDVNSIACIEDKCYVLTYNEYCRYRSSLCMDDDIVSLTTIVVPELSEHYSRKNRLPAEAMSSDIVFFCRHVYDFRQKRILKNPT